MEDGTKTQKKEGARADTSKRLPVTDPDVLYALDELFKKKETLKRRPGFGYFFGRLKPVHYAQYYGRLNKDGDIGTLKTIILSSEIKVYQLNDDGKHMELKWQNDKHKKNPAYGTITLIREGGNYQCSILSVFKTELSLYL